MRTRARHSRGCSYECTTDDESHALAILESGCGWNRRRAAEFER